MRDTQRQKVYNWERTLPSWRSKGTITLDQCEQIVREIERAYGVRITVGPGRRHRRAVCYNRSHIELPKWARNPGVVLHECAHALTVDGHGPAFVRVFLDLLERFTPDALAASMREMRSQCSARNIKVAGESSHDWRRPLSGVRIKPLDPTWYIIPPPLTRTYRDHLITKNESGGYTATGPSIGSIGCGTLTRLKAVLDLRLDCAHDAWRSIPQWPDKQQCLRCRMIRGRGGDGFPITPPDYHTPAPEERVEIAACDSR